MFEKLRNKINSFSKLNYNEKMVVEGSKLPFNSLSVYSFCSDNVKNFDYLNFEDCKYEIFKYRDPRVPGNEFAYICVGEANFINKDSERFIVGITDLDLAEIISSKNSTYSFDSIVSDEKFDLINSFDKNQISGHSGYNHVIGDLINYEVENGTSYRVAINNFSDLDFYSGNNINLLYINKDFEGKTILDVAKEINPELYNGLLKEGFLSNSQVDNYNTGNELNEANVLKLANYSFDSDLFIGQKTEVDKDVVNYKYENVFMSDTNQFFIKGIKEFEDSSKNEEFVEFVHYSKGLALLAKEVDIINDKSWCSLDKKIDILLDSGVADWKKIISSNLLSDINDFDKIKQAEILNQLDCNGETALDVVIKNRYLSEASDFMEKGALTKEELDKKAEKENIIENANVKDDGNEF